MPADIATITVLHALIQVAMLMLLIRGLLWLFGPRTRQGNFFYDILTIGTAPFVRLTRAVTPKFVRDKYIPTETFVLVFLIWMSLGLAKAVLCTTQGIASCAV